MLVCLFVQFPFAAQAIEPAGSLIQVEYVKTINGDEVVVRDPYGADVPVKLIAIGAEPVSSGSPEAYAAAAETAALLLKADELYMETQTGQDSQTAPPDVWLWYTIKQADGKYTRKLANAELLRTGNFRFEDTPACDVYRDELLAAMPVDGAEMSRAPRADDEDSWVWRTRAGIEPHGYFKPGDGTTRDVTMRNSCVVTPTVKDDQPGTWIRVRRSTDATGKPYPLELMDDGKVVGYFDLVNVSQNHIANMGVQLDYMNKDGRTIVSARSGVLNLGPEEVRRIAVVIQQLDLEQLQYIVY